MANWSTSAKSKMEEHYRSAIDRIDEIDTLDKLNDYQHKHMEPLYGYSPFMENLVNVTLPELARSKQHILILGDTGTGKEVIARKIVELSSKSFLAVNCASIPENLAESQIFGHTKGAFTGATDTKKGYLDQANDGVLFLDEIGELPTHVQAKLLRVFQEKEFIPLGASKPTKFSGRLLAATHSPQTLRDDVLWRFLHKIIVPPLRERREDILAIMRGFLWEHFKKQPVDWAISPTTFVNLLFSPWMGNVRELRNAMDTSLERVQCWYTDEWNHIPRIPFFYSPSPDTCPRLCDVRETFQIWKYIARAARKMPGGKKLITQDFDQVHHMEYFFHMKGAFGNEPGFPPTLNSGYEFSLQNLMEIILLCEKPKPPRRKQVVKKPAPGVIDKRDGARWIVPLINVFSIVLREFARYWKIPSEMMSFYNEGLDSASSDQRPVDLTGYSEEALLSEYYRQLLESFGGPQSHGVVVKVQKAAGISHDVASNRLARYGLRHKNTKIIG